MAYNFNGTSQYLDLASAAVTAVPLTITCFISPNATLNNTGVFGVFRTAISFEGFYIGTYTVDNTPTASVAAAGTFVHATATATLTNGQWNHVAAVFTSSTSRDCYLNGANKGSETTNKTPVTIQKTIAGAFWNQSISLASNFSNARLAECAIWNAALDAGEIAALARGYSPASIRPDKLAFYAPLVRGLQNYIGGVSLTNNASSTVIEHPRIIMPRGRRISYVIPPLRQVHYRFRTDGNAADAAPTWGAAEDAGGYDPGASNFRLRVSVANTGAAVGAQPFELYLSKNSGAYAPITTTSTGGVKSADASTDADETIIKIPRLTPGT